MKSIIKNIVTGDASTEPGKTRNEVTEDDRRETARRHLAEFANHNTQRMVYCELCEQVFVSFDTFYDHRVASDHDAARRGDEQFEHYRDLRPGHSFPDNATVGQLEPCKPAGDR